MQILHYSLHENAKGHYGDERIRLMFVVRLKIALTAGQHPEFVVQIPVEAL